jgi:RNA polymerase sigma-70 factor (ECF subfamily)
VRPSSRTRYRGEGKFSTFIYGVARNQLLAHFRKRKSQGRMSAPLQHSVADLGPSPSTVLGRDAEERRLYEAICRLPLDLQIALELFYWVDVPSREIAAILSEPESTIRSRLRRARLQLRKALDLPDEALPPSTTDAQEFDKSEWIQRIRTSALEGKRND